MSSPVWLIKNRDHTCWVESESLSLSKGRPSACNNDATIEKYRKCMHHKLDLIRLDYNRVSYSTSDLSGRNWWEINACPLAHKLLERSRYTKWRTQEDLNSVKSIRMGNVLNRIHPSFWNISYSEIVVNISWYLLMYGNTMIETKRKSEFIRKQYNWERNTWDLCEQDQFCDSTITDNLQNNCKVF
jgi:hypothetical protein